MIKLRFRLSRRQLIFVSFLIFIFLNWRISSHPKVHSALTPDAWFNQYDERACLPQRAIDAKPPQRKAKAAFVVLVRNKEQTEIMGTIENLESRFNKNFHYPYVFLNDEPFSNEFKRAVRAASPHVNMEFGLIPSAHWSYPSWVNQTHAAECRDQMKAAGVYYGESESYRHMCRFNSGFFFQHHLLDGYDWYWRVEPGVRFFCDITYDPFLFMEKHHKRYSFVITLREIPQTIPSLWKTVLEYAATREIDLGTNHNNHLLFPYFVDPATGDYNRCHFWSNFEIASLDLWREARYIDFFNYLDETGNFFYERWGDAPVHSLAAGLFLDTDEIHYFEDFAYQHDWYRHCPSKNSKLECRCNCPVGDSKLSLDFDLQPDSCLPLWKEWVKRNSKGRKGAWGKAGW